MKEAYYFSHDANARNDAKILELRSELGWHGYGLFWAIIETLRDCSTYSFPNNARSGLAFDLRISKSELETLISKCIELELLTEENGSFYSESLMRRMEEVDKKRAIRAEAGRKGGNAKAMLQQCSSNALAKPSKERKEKEKKEDKLIDGKPSEQTSFLSMFEHCQKIYPGTKRGAKVEFSDLEKKYKKEFSREFFLAIYNGIQTKISTNEELTKTKGFVPEWPHLKTYLNQRRWEEETKVIPIRTAYDSEPKPKQLTQEEHDKLMGLSPFAIQQREEQRKKDLTDDYYDNYAKS